MKQKKLEISCVLLGLSKPSRHYSNILRASKNKLLPLHKCIQFSQLIWQTNQNIQCANLEWKIEMH